jgi:hypothetical protein
VKISAGNISAQVVEVTFDERPQKKMCPSNSFPFLSILANFPKVAPCNFQIWRNCISGLKPNLKKKTKPEKKTSRSGRVLKLKRNHRKLRGGQLGA